MAKLDCFFNKKKLVRDKKHNVTLYQRGNSRTGSRTEAKKISTKLTINKRFIQ